MSVFDSRKRPRNDYEASTFELQKHSSNDEELDDNYEIVQSEQHCLNEAKCNKLCYCCGYFTPFKMQRSFTANLKKLYFNHFHTNVWLDRDYAVPKKLCSTCERILEFGGDRLQYSKPMLWRKPTNHSDDCYICKCHENSLFVGQTAKTRVKIKYPNVSTITTPNWIASGTKSSKNSNNNNTNNNNTTTITTANNNSISSYSNNVNSSITNNTSNNSNNRITTTTITANNNDRITQSELSSVTSQPDNNNDLDYLPIRNTQPIMPSRESIELYFAKLRHPTNRQRRAFLSFLYNHNSLSKDITIESFMKPHEDFLHYFRRLSPVLYPNTVYASNPKNLMLDVTHNRYEAKDYRLFVDSGKKSLKVALLHNGNKLRSVPICFSYKSLQENYNNIKLVFDKLISYELYMWKIVSDLKMINILVGLCGGNPTYPCFRCLWKRTQTRDELYAQTEVELRSSYKGVPNLHKYKKAVQLRLIKANFSIANDAIISDPSLILLPSLHMKLGFYTQFILALDQEGAPFKRLTAIFPDKPEGWLAKGTVNGPEIRKMNADRDFYWALSPIEQRAFNALNDVCVYIFTNATHPTLSREQIVDEFFYSFYDMGCGYTYKMHLLRFHLDHLPELASNYSDEMGELLHQLMREFVRDFNFKDKNMRSMIAYYAYSAKILNLDILSNLDKFFYD